MNKHLKELEPQCWEYNEFGLTFNYEKFADLIIREMLRTCVEHPAWYGRMIAEEIKQHFGLDK